MSAEYLLKMELLRKNREDLAAKRQAIERRIALREATAAEYSAAALQNCKQKWKSLRAAAITAKSRNDEFIREIHETQRKVNEAYYRCKEGLWPSYNQLEQEKERYFRKVEEVYPAWQEKMQALRLQKLRDLEEKKRTIEKRRYLAKQSFETEQTVDDLIRQTRHEIELAENLEKNEAYERQLLRDQTSRDASQLDQTIREHAAGARLYMKQQANDHLHDPDGMDEEFKERIFETFSPRSAVQTLREARSSVVLAEPQPVEDDQPRRKLTLTVTQSYRPSSAIDYDDSNFETPVPVPESIDSPDRLQDETTAVQYPTLDDIEESFADEILSADLSMPERLKALTALIGRVEDGIGDGDQISASVDIGSSMETKRDLLRMAVAGRKAQINFFGTDICFEVVVTIARELGAVLFPPKSFEGIMNEQKMKKVHQNAKEKESDIWKALSAHLKQLHTLKAMPVSALVDVFVTAFLNHDPDNQRSQRKLREFLFSICGASESSPKKELNSTSSLPSAQSANSAPSPPKETAPTSQMPSLLQTAFLQHSSPPKGAKTFGIASSGSRKASSSDDILKSMASSPTRLGQKILRGGKMGDYSEFEEEDEVNLENLIGKKSMAKPASSTGNTNARGGGNASRMATMREADDFDVDF
ncbi:hypothetical protein Poli38472_000868 [Pythium oligandrum]|uniref:Uncharacterized protein n=1 Tax=Pythium oligandrum TaxID=41045 RepID=A0A8K1FFR2_PYTOL|nr:hypothetical protein Poli38472_000868 [Pythium oligandrum]|eukprot:TMW60826.1 hypothetical protein Poli38472_000868 [Pythium oligandrum]